MSSQLVGLRVPFCWQIDPAGGLQTGLAPSWQVGVEVHWAAAEVEGVILGGRQTVGVSLTVTVDAEQIVGALVTVTVDAGQVPVVLAEVAHVFEEDCTAVQVLGDVVADDLAGLVCEVVLPGAVVLLGTLTVVLRYISPSTQHSFSVNVALPMESPQCRCYNTVSMYSIKAQYIHTILVR